MNIRRREDRLGCKGLFSTTVWTLNILTGKRDYSNENERLHEKSFMFRRNDDVMLRTDTCDSTM